MFPMPRYKGYEKDTIHYYYYTTTHLTTTNTTTTAAVTTTPTPITTTIELLSLQISMSPLPQWA